MSVYIEKAFGGRDGVHRRLAFIVVDMTSNAEYGDVVSMEKILEYLEEKDDLSIH